MVFCSMPHDNHPPVTLTSGPYRVLHITDREVELLGPENSDVIKMSRSSYERLRERFPDKYEGPRAK